MNTGVQFNITGNDTATTLSAFILFDTTLSPLDTSGKMLFHYDNKKRNTRIDYTYYDNGVPMDLSPRVDFFYNGNDTEPYKKVFTTPFLTAGDEEYSNDTCFYFYMNGVLIGDSAIRIIESNKFTDVRKFVYYSDKIVITATDYNYNSPNGYTRKDSVDMAYANGNIIRQTRRFVDLGVEDERTFLYDDHINPFYATQSKIAIDNVFPYFLYWEEELHVPDIFAKNNALEINEVASGFYSSHAKLTYQYKANGYPKYVLSINDEMMEYYKGIYIYTN